MAAEARVRGDKFLVDTFHCAPAGGSPAKAPHACGQAQAEHDGYGAKEHCRHGIQGLTVCVIYRALHLSQLWKLCNSVSIVQGRV